MFSGSKNMTENVFQLKMKLTLILIGCNFSFQKTFFNVHFFSIRVKYFMLFSANHVNKYLNLLVYQQLFQNIYFFL